MLGAISKGGDVSSDMNHVFLFIPRSAVAIDGSSQTSLPAKA